MKSLRHSKFATRHRITTTEARMALTSQIGRDVVYYQGYERRRELRGAHILWKIMRSNWVNSERV